MDEVKRRLMEELTTVTAEQSSKNEDDVIEETSGLIDDLPPIVININNDTDHWLIIIFTYCDAICSIISITILSGHVLIMSPYLREFGAEKDNIQSSIDAQS